MHCVLIQAKTSNLFTIHFTKMSDYACPHCNIDQTPYT